ncbi:MAG: hypothetical protein R3E77_14640 [Steroidobacteraceae bacterium]
MARNTELLTTASIKGRALAAITLLASVVSSTTLAQGVTRLVDTVDVSAAERNVNIYLQFNCSLRYLSHSPADLGKEVTVRMRLGADCGTPQFIGGERPPLVGGEDFVRSVRVEDSVPGEVLITIGWKYESHFVWAPTTDGRGFRFRLLDALPAKPASVRIQEFDQPYSGLAVNLDSSRNEFSQTDIDAASAFLGLPARVSTLELEGVIWYRLRVGPIANDRDAKRLLGKAKEQYPRAWLGIDDDESVTMADGGTLVDPSVAATVPVDPPLSDAERNALLDQAETALRKKDYPKAVELLTKLTRQPEFLQRAKAQELLGLARERSGQLAHAKAEYEEYLRRYPDGEAVRRIRSRLRALRFAGRAGKRGTRDVFGAFEHGWSFRGGASQLYRWERFTLDAPEVAIDRQSQNAVYTDGDFISQYRGDRFDFIGRVTAGFAKDMLTGGPGDETRVSYAYAELSDRERGLTGRVGRQARNAEGLLGTFDGLHLSYQLKPSVTVNAAAGFPVESTRQSPTTARQFVGLSANFGPFNDKWDFGTFVVGQQYSGDTDRRAVGFEGRYFVPGRTLIALVDFDTYFGTLNTAVLMGNWSLPARWTLSFNLDHRNAPVLTTRNALIGQPVATLAELRTLFSDDEIRQLAEDRTVLSDLYTVSLARPLGERFQLSLDAYATRYADTPASGGVAATPESGLDMTYQLQLFAASWLRSGDLFSLTARHQSSDAFDLDSVGLAARLPVAQNWRLGPRLRVDMRTTRVDAADEILYVPALRLDYQRGPSWFEFEAGAELGQRDIPADKEKSRRYYFGIGYRFNF